MNQDTGWFNSYDKCGPDQRNHPLARYTNTPQPNQPPRLWDQVPGLPSPVCIGHNIQSLHPYGGGFIPNQFHPAYTPRPMGSYQTYAPHNPGYNYQNNQTPRMRNNNSRWQRRNRQDRPRGFSNYSPGGFQHSTPGPSKQEPKTQEIETEEQSSELPVKVLDIRPPETTTSIHIIEDDDDNVATDCKPKIKEEDKKLLMEYIDLSDEKDSPEEALNKFEFESRTKVLDKLCGTIDEAKFIEGLKQFKIILKDQICAIRLKSRLITMLMKYILFLGMNYKSLASGFVEEYLDLMEDVIAMFCQVVTDFINMQIADNKRTFIERLGFQIKQLISCSLLFRMDSIMHCLFKVHLSPVFLEGHSAMWTDVFLYFLRNSKFDPKHDDLLRIFVAWKRLLSIRTSKDAKMINGYMFESLRKPLEELKSLPYLKEFIETYHENPRCNTQEMLNKYWKWWKEERPKQLWAGLEEPTYIQLPGTFNLEYQPANVCLMNQSTTESQDDEISKLFEDRRTGKSPGLTQLGRKMPYGRQNNLFWPNSLGNIFDDSPCMASDFDYYDDNDLIIAEPRVVETVVVDDDDDDDDVIFIGDGKESNAQQVDVVEKTTEVIEESNIDDLNCEELVNEEVLFNPETSLEVEVQPDKEISPKEIDESRNETAIKEICDSFVSSYPEDSDSNDDIVDFPIEDNLPSTLSSNDDIFDKWEKTFDNQAPDNSDFFDLRETSTIEETTLKLAEQSVNEVEPPKSPEEFNGKDCDESSKTETESSQKEITEIVPEKATNDTEKLPNEQEKLSETSTAKTKYNGSLGICMQDLREVLNEMEIHYKQSDEEKKLCLKEVPLVLEEPLLKHINLSTEEKEEDNLDNYAAIVQVACSDDDINEFASGYEDGVCDSGEISSPAFEPLESFDSEKQQQEIIDSSVISETLATEPVISPEEASLCQSDSEQTVDKDEELFIGPPTVVEVPESISTAVINLASPCHDNSDLITIKCGLVLKQEQNVEEVQPNFVLNNYELEKYSGYHLEGPQRQDSFPEPPPQSGSQPYSPPSIRIGNAVSALDENSTMLYTPILQDSQKIQPAIVPDVLPQQDLPKQNAVPPAPESSKLVDKLKIVKLQSAPVIERPSSSSNSTTEASETPDKPKKRSRRGCPTKDSLKSKKREKLAKPLSPQDNGLFEYAIEGPTGKPLWNTAPNMLWDDSEDPYESPKSPLLVKSDKQLVSILKKPNVAKKIKEIEKAKAYNQPRLIDEKNEATNKKNLDSLHYPLSNFINNASLSQTNNLTDYYSNLHFTNSQVYLSADNPKLTPASPFLPEEMLEINSKKLEEPAIVLMPEQYQESYLSLSKTLFGDSLPATNESNNILLETQKINEDLPINNFIVEEPQHLNPAINQYYEPPVPFYEPAKATETLLEPSVVYQAPAPLLDSKITSKYFVKAQLPPKKRKLTEEDELAYYIQKLKEEKEPKPKLEENISYPAQRQMSIADVQRDFPKGVVKTLAARKIYPGDPSAYPDPDYYGFDQYNDFNNKRSIMNVYINGVRDYSAKYPFCLMIGMGTAGQPSSAESGGDEAAELPLNYQVPVAPKPIIEETPAAQPRAKRARKVESVAAETPVPPKRGRGRPRKNPII